MADDSIEISLGGKDYRVACPENERDSLLEAASLLDARLRELAGKTGATGEKLAIMTALNVAHEFIEFQRAGGFDMPELRRRIGDVNARLEDALARQEKLF